MGERFLAALRELEAQSKGVISGVRGRGLMMAMTLPDTDTRNRFWKACFEAGLLVIRCGERCVRLRPYLDVNADVIDESIGLMREGLRRLDV
jgi:L-lysine 6-transaminase